MLAAAACSEADPRPPMVGDCNDPSCVDNRGQVPLPLPGIGNSGGSAGAAGGGNTPGATLAGTVGEVSSSDLLTLTSLRDSVEVRAPNATANGDEITGVPGPGGIYRLDGVRQSGVVWVGVGAFQIPSVEPYMDTLQAADTTQSGVVDLFVVRRDLMRQLATTAFMVPPVELDPDRAAIVIRFVDERGAPAAGVRITIPDPTVIRTAYDAGDTYSDSLDATLDRGMALLLNLEAAAYPGSATSIVAEVDGVPLTTNLLIAQGAVTVVTAVIPDP
jgi:hypothetical protein